ncbi:MAG: hypothetical protein ACON35_02885 [Candidatus Marinamargulisbacteria bacterium]
MNGSLKKTVATSFDWALNEKKNGLQHDLGNMYAMFGYCFPDNERRSENSPKTKQDLEAFIENFKQKLKANELTLILYSKDLFMFLINVFEFIALGENKHVFCNNWKEDIQKLINFVRMDRGVNMSTYDFIVGDGIRFNDYSYEQRCLMIRVIFETTFNAAKYARDTFWRFSVTIRGTDIRVYYEDNGGGFTFGKTGKPKVSENSTGGQGLRLLQVDAVRLGGLLTLSNHVHELVTGATVELLLPLRNSAGCCNIS